MNNMLNVAITSTISSWGIKFANLMNNMLLGVKNINFISMRDHNSPPSLNNMFIGVIASSISPWGIKIRHPFEPYFGSGNNINFVFMRDQNSPHPLNNMLNGAITSTLSPWGIKICHPYEQYVEWGNDINYIFMRDQNSPALWTICWMGQEHQLYLHEGSKFATPMNNILNGAITSTISSWGIKIRHPYKQYVDWGHNTNFLFMMVMMMITTMNVHVYDYDYLMVVVVVMMMMMMMMVVMMMINVHDYDYHDVIVIVDDDDVVVVDDDDDDDGWYAFRHSTFGKFQQIATVPRFRRGATSGLHRNCLNHMSPVSRRQVSHTLRCSYVRTCAVQAWLMRRVWESWKGKRERERHRKLVLSWTWPCGTWLAFCTADNITRSSNSV